MQLHKLTLNTVILVRCNVIQYNILTKLIPLKLFCRARIADHLLGTHLGNEYKYLLCNRGE
jgi:hypothetical protein